MTSISKAITNVLYRVSGRVKKFQQQHPDSQVFAAGAVKARKFEDDHTPRYEYGWATARRSVLILASDGLHCGDWFIPLDSIEETILLRTASGLLLKIGTTDDLYYQFGLSYDPAWEAQTLLPMEAEPVALGFSMLSVVMRVVVILYFSWLIIGDFTQHRVNLVTFIYMFFIMWILIPVVRNLYYQYG